MGIITNRDMRFMEGDDFEQPIKNVMTKENLVTAPVGTTLKEAQGILRKHRIEKLPLVDDQMHLKGLITIKDIEKAVRYPNSARTRAAGCCAALPSAPPRTCWTGWPPWWRPRWTWSPWTLPTATTTACWTPFAW